MSSLRTPSSKISSRGESMSVGYCSSPSGDSASAAAAASAVEKAQDDGKVAANTDATITALGLEMITRVAECGVSELQLLWLKVRQNTKPTQVGWEEQHTKYEERQHIFSV